MDVGSWEIDERKPRRTYVRTLKGAKPEAVHADAVYVYLVVPRTK